MEYRKKFITFEGCEGVGKSTQLTLLKEYLEKTKQPAVFTREPGGNALAEKIRGLILSDDMTARCEALLFAAARCEHIDKVILPALNEGLLVICDRFIDSSIAYQGYARNLGKELVLNYNEYTINNCMPQATVFIDMNPLVSWRRQKGKIIENDRLEREKDEFHSKVYQGYTACAKEEERFIRIIPDVDKNVTSNKIITALREKEIIH